ncbi:MAG: lysine--tRNA ligase [Myxococcota bacterium]|nr:lysine--tRNA ligase [Myxococcota bacterium]
MEDTLMEQRRQKAAGLRDAGHNPYANTFRVQHLASDILATHDGKSAEQLEEQSHTVAVAGRVRAVRKFGKVVFVTLDDRSGTIQANFFKPELPDATFNLLSMMDLGDIIGVQGTVMVTRRGEVSIKVSDFEITTKALRPLPDKWHGLTDVSARYRQRYVDLIVNPDVRETFKARARIVKYIRSFLDDRDYLEVETPMLQPIYGGANARPFKTHHNTLDMQLFLRIAPELNLKRLVVGGFHRVYEINRCFRNEGVSTRHNPEFTMLEFYEAFATYEDLMDLTEDMLHGLCLALHNSPILEYGDTEISFEKPFRRLSVYEGLTEYAGIPADKVCDRDTLADAAKGLGIKKIDDLPLGYLQMEVFEASAEEQLIQPTFVTDFPLDVSPLSRKKDSDPTLVDRFELYIAGRELCNAFSELNDPDDQRSRFEAQVAQRATGDDEAHPMDEDYVRALEYGMPPAAGQGIGIDRLTMLMTNKQSIRDVIFFPLMRPEA